MQTREQPRTWRPQPTATRVKRPFGGGVKGNDHLTAVTGAVLLVLLAIEGVTIPFLHRLLTVHIFVGMLLLGPVALKLASAGYRVVRYYAGSPEYVRRGPPAPAMRVLVAPALVLSTLTLFGTGVGLIVVGPGRGALLGLHKASFVVWVFVMSIHVLAYTARAARHSFADFGRHRLRGAPLRLALVLAALGLGFAVAMLTLPLASPWQHWTR